MEAFIKKMTDTAIRNNSIDPALYLKYNTKVISLMRVPWFQMKVDLPTVEF